MDGSSCGNRRNNIGDRSSCNCHSGRSSCGCGGGGCGSATIAPQREAAGSYIPDVDVDDDAEANMEDYLMNMTSLSTTSKGKTYVVPHNVTLGRSKSKSRPVVETVEREISPDIKQYNTKIVEEDPCSGKKAVMHVSHVMNTKTGTVITVQRTDYTGGCPLKDKNISYGFSNRPA